MAALLVLTAGACQRVEEGVEDLQEQVEEAAPDADGPPGAAPQSEGGPDGSSIQPSDGGALGENARLYLHGDVPKLMIEVDAVEGSEPAGSSLDHLGGVLGSVADKPGGIEVMATQTFASSGGSYRTADLRALEGEHRETASSEDVASLYVLVLDGEFADNSNALGVAYSASAFAIFRNKIEGAAGVLGSAARIERSVVAHEAGHILRLVNVGYDSPRSREDPDHPHHSTNRGSVMFWAVESDLISEVLSGPPPDDFDDADRADLADIKTGRLG